jgi:hypothetical protein
MADKYNYIISIEEVRPLPSGERFAAEVTKLVCKLGIKPELVPLALKALGHKYWGKTREEAHAKAKAKVDAWIAAQGGEGSEA